MYSVDKKTKFNAGDEKFKKTDNPFSFENIIKMHSNHEKFESEISTVRKDINKFNQKNSEIQKNLNSKDNKMNNNKNFVEKNKNISKTNSLNKDKISNLKKK